MSEQRKTWPPQGQDGMDAKIDPDQQRGLRCPRCGCGHFRVIYTRTAWGGRIVRRRECRHCGRRMITTERVTG